MTMSVAHCHMAPVHASLDKRQDKSTVFYVKSQEYSKTTKYFLREFSFPATLCFTAPLPEILSQESFKIPESGLQ